ncbi:MAG TPA: hemerythrin domain-containing protein [Myxococcota bacterium]|nr:hemerythrin domain-containing protein [Myxococcota bacterium]
MKHVAEQIQAQHRRLAPLAEELGRAIASRLPRDAQTAAFRFEGALRAHFLLEQEVVFPAIRGCFPLPEPEIDRFADDHRRIDATLRALIEHVLECELELADRCLEACWLAIRDHERREEALLGGLDSAGRARTL